LQHFAVQTSIRCLIQAGAPPAPRAKWQLGQRCCVLMILVIHESAQKLRFGGGTPAARDALHKTKLLI
jgi:hypothetical protein